MADDAPQHQQQEQEVARVLRACHAFDVLQLAVREHEEADVKRAYRRLALLLHPDKNSHEDAKAAFVRVADGYEQLRHPTSQRQALVALRKPSHAKPQKGGAAKATAAAAASTRPRKPRSFMEVMREWEEFEREFMAENQRTAERQHRAEKKRSQLADRAEREAAERQRLADAVLEEDEEAFQARSDSWASFMKGKKKRSKKEEDG